MSKLTLSTGVKPAKTILRISLAIALLAFSDFGQPAADANVPGLVLGQPIERSMKGGETHSFQVNVKAGHYARVEVESRNIDVIASLFSPDGKLVVEMDGKDGRLWREVVSAIAEKDAVYRIEIRGYGAAEKVGIYTIKLARSLLGTLDDRKQVEAEARFYVGRKAFLQEKADYPLAHVEYQAAAKLLREIKEQQWEAITLYHLGIVSSYLSKHDQVIETQMRAAELFRSTKDRLGEYRAINVLAAAYHEQGKYIEALKYRHQALEITRELKDRRGEAMLLINIAAVYNLRSEYKQSKQYYEQVLAIAQETKNKGQELDAFQGLGIAYSNQAEYEKSINYLEGALKLSEEMRNQRSKASVLLALGIVYYRLNQLEKAQQILGEALSTSKEAHDQIKESYSLMTLGKIYGELNQIEKAIGNLELSLKIRQEIKDRIGEGHSLGNLGIIYGRLGQYGKAEDYLKQAVAIARDIKDRNSEGYELNQLAYLYLAQKSYENARQTFEHALSVAGPINDRIEQGLAYSGLLKLSEQLNKPQHAIFYGKQAVNTFQGIRNDSKGLDRESQQGFLKTIDGTYRQLANILISEGRFAEAQAVLDLLKEKEFKGITRSGDVSETIPYSRAEAGALKHVENLASLDRERADLLKLKEKGTLPADKQARLDQLPNDIEVANKAFRLSLDALGRAEASAADRVAEIQSEQNLQRALGQLGKELKTGAVALYTVLGPEEVTQGQGGTNVLRSKFGWMILVTPTTRKAYPIDVTDLEKTVFDFRKALSSDRYDAEPLARRLYQKLFRQTSEKQKVTLEADLASSLSKYRDKTVMWSLDGVLRYIPMAALHDGKGYLIEKYRNVIFTKESFLTLMVKDAARWNALGMGLSEQREGFDSLPGVERELKDIIRLPQTSTGILRGTIKLNNDFGEEATIKLWRENAYPVVHIASHYKFNAADPTASFLLLGDGRLTFSEMQDKANLFGSVDLLTLSACDTAMGGANGKEAEGFAYLAQSLGAKSVIASLWKVSDAGTPELMIRFYKLRAANPQMSKGEAFRQAQLSLLHGESTRTNRIHGGPRSEIVNVKGKKDELPLFVKDEKRPFAHPHYWSSFVLIGNWR